MCRFIANEAYYKGAYPACLKQYGLCMHQRIVDKVVKIFQFHVKRFVENSIIITFYTLLVKIFFNILEIMIMMAHGKIIEHSLACIHKLYISHCNMYALLRSTTYQSTMWVQFCKKEILFYFRSKCLAFYIFF